MCGVPISRLQSWIIQRDEGGREETERSPQIVPLFVRLRYEDSRENCQQSHVMLGHQRLHSNLKDDKLVCKAKALPATGNSREKTCIVVL
jgi:hypothetical protein